MANYINYMLISKSKLKYKITYLDINNIILKIEDILSKTQ